MKGLLAATIFETTHSFATTEKFVDSNFISCALIQAVSLVMLNSRFIIVKIDFKAGVKNVSACTSSPTSTSSLAITWSDPVIAGSPLAGRTGQFFSQLFATSSCYKWLLGRTNKFLCSLLREACLQSNLGWRRENSRGLHQCRKPNQFQGLRWWSGSD